jgi:hypothetical protein
VGGAEERMAQRGWLRGAMSEDGAEEDGAVKDGAEERRRAGL